MGREGKAVLGVQTRTGIRGNEGDSYQKKGD